MLTGLLGTTRPALSQTLDPAFRPTVTYTAQLQRGTVRAMSQMADGRLLVAGNFVLFNNWPTNNVARLWPDGRVDTTFLAPAFSGGDILALAPDAQGRVVMAGTFTAVDGQARSSVARLLADGRLDPAFRPDVRPTYSGGPPASVRAVVVQPDGKVLLGGSFVAAGSGGALVPHVVRLLPSGLPDPGFVPAMPFSGQVGALLLLPTGEVLVAGNTYANNSLELVRRLLPNGSLDPAFTIVPANQVLAGIGLAMAPTPTGFVLVGAYYSIGNVGRASVARFQANGALDLSFTSPLPPTLNNAAPLGAVAVEAGGEVFIGGDINIGGNMSYLRRLLPTGAFDPNYSGVVGGPDGTVTALVLQPDGKLLIAGNFGNVSGQPRSGLARLLAPNALATGTAQAATGFTVYPVPAHEQLHLQFQAPRLPQQVRLFDALGRVVRTAPVTQPELTVSTAGLPAGIYQLRVAYAQGDAIGRRVVVE
jgi:uncharacterized delta-60 repeat protein